MSRILGFGIALACALLTTAAWGDQMLTLDPVGGAVVGPAGTTVGWGFTFTNNDSDYAVLDQSGFCDASSPVPFVCNPVSPDLGTYNDFISSQFLVVGPSPEISPLSQSFNISLLTGIGSFDLDPSASGTASGIILVTYDLYSVSPNDPSFDPVNDFISAGNYLTASASVTVGPAVVTPEPRLLPLLILALGIVILLRVRRSQRANA